MGGLEPAQCEAIRGVFEGFPGVEEVQLYGSRAMGRYHAGSDVDLALLGEVNAVMLNRISEQLDDLLLPYTFDLSIFEDIDNAELRDHILRVGQTFFRRVPV